MFPCVHLRIFYLVFLESVLKYTYILIFFFVEVKKSKKKWNFKKLYIKLKAKTWAYMLTSNSIGDEIVFTQNLFVIYPIYCGLKFSINLRIVISIFILNNFWTYPVVVPSSPEGFTRKIWCFYGYVSIDILPKFLFHIYCYCSVVIHFNSRIDIEGIQDFFPTILTFWEKHWPHLRYIPKGLVHCNWGSL